MRCEVDDGSERLRRVAVRPRRWREAVADFDDSVLWRALEDDPIDRDTVPKNRHLVVAERALLVTAKQAGEKRCIRRILTVSARHLAQRPAITCGDGS